LCAYDKSKIGKDIGVCSNRFVSLADLGGISMSDYMEVINPKTMIGKLMHNGEIVEEYKVEQCDKCSMLTKFDRFGYQKGYGNENVIWFCQGCR
jgi:hypothetical protein